MSGLIDLVPAHVREFESYTPSRPDPVLMRQYGVSHLYRLNNNENALGPPPLAREAIAAYAPDRAAIYPNGDAYDLRLALAAKFGKSPDQFLVGNGSCEGIGSVVRAFCALGDAIVTVDRTFAVYEWVARFTGIEARLVPLRDQALDPGAMLAAATGRTKIVFVCNPNNPTGSWWNRRTLDRFLTALGGRAVVVLDEAYREFIDDPDFPDGMEVIDRHANVLVFRTFSKMYGLAGLRVGYLCGSLAAVDIVRRTQIAYSVNALGQIAATAALADDAGHIAATRRMVGEARDFLGGLFAAMGLEQVSGAGNYIMVRTPVSDTLLYRRLMREGVMVRTMTSFRFPGWIRITLAREPAMEAFARAFRKVLDKS
ncbi:histidinol-phosphate aminotransferase [Solidesulfovibrio carbinoliphilus subsp. oakridgensis]|uniref:Histidinol-phosphate aminotransferase n=1 Tax=Solidesulfovibrio carbinoliphilus subsp. oakridgensis TaxID=694327 RepID=G7Q4V7_9BACT|nr:histidinol-phosphate transaminase [Solidesulfovibrio carbinoliphilus]EHJ47567.1 histidinol-phosphate aminotransferase [Solidesulfovibrio carbinoliphilus subsp. oakridgensis]